MKIQFRVFSVSETKPGVESSLFTDTIIIIRLKLSHAYRDSLIILKAPPCVYTDS